MYLDNLINILSKHYLITIGIILYISAYFPYIYNIYKNKKNNQKFKILNYFLIILASLFILIHSIIAKHYEIVLFCLIKIIIALLIIFAILLFK